MAHNVVLLGEDLVFIEPGKDKHLTREMELLIDDIFQVEQEIKSLEAEVHRIKTDAQLEKKKDLLKKLMIKNVPVTLNQHDNPQHVARRGDIEVIMWFVQRDKVDKDWAKENLHPNTFHRIWQEGKKSSSIRLQDVTLMKSKE